MVTQGIFVSGLSAKRYGGPGAFVVVFPLDGKYSARRSVLTEKSGGFFAMEMRGVILALNGIRRVQEAEIGTFCNHPAGYVGRKGNRSWRDSHDVGRELRDALRGAISRYEEVSAVT